MKQLAKIVALIGWSVCCAGCASGPYQYGVRDVASTIPSGNAGGLGVIQSGGHHPVVDRIESIVQAPRRFFRKQFQQQPYDPIAETEARQAALNRSVEYLAANGLNDLQIDYRRYEPREQWARLKANDRVAPFWKYTVGALDVARYSIVPDRALHRDRYDPLTNTLSINSTNPNRAVLEAASAKEFAQHQRLGTYAAAQRLPFVNTYHQSNVASDALSYARANEGWEAERRLYPTAYANVAGSLANGLGQIPLVQDAGLNNPVTNLALRGAGSLAGRAVADAEERKRNGDAVLKQSP